MKASVRQVLLAAAVVIFTTACDRAAEPVAPATLTPAIVPPTPAPRPAVLTGSNGLEVSVTIETAYPGYTGVPASIVTSAINPEGLDLVCVVTRQFGAGGELRRLELPSCTSSVPITTPTAGDYSIRGGCGDAGSCYWDFEVYERGRPGYILYTRLFSGRSVLPYRITAVQSVADGPIAISRKACAGRYTACVKFAVSSPGRQLGFAPYNVAIDWGDGTMWTPNSISAFDVSLLAGHDYTTPGTYNVRLVAYTVNRNGPSVTQPDFFGFGFVESAIDTDGLTLTVAP